MESRVRPWGRGPPLADHRGPGSEKQPKKPKNECFSRAIARENGPSGVWRSEGSPGAPGLLSPFPSLKFSPEGLANFSQNAYDREADPGGGAGDTEAGRQGGLFRPVRWITPVTVCHSGSSETSGSL